MILLNFIFFNLILKVIFHLKLLQNIGYISHVVHNSSLSLPYTQ